MKEISGSSSFRLLININQFEVGVFMPLHDIKKEIIYRLIIFLWEICVGKPFC